MSDGRCDPGLNFEAVVEVGAADAVGGGEALLCPAAVLRLAEAACADALNQDLPHDQTSFGTWSEVSLLAMVPVGSSVHVRATLLGHHGRRLEFSVLVTREGSVVARVRHRRELIDRSLLRQRTCPPSAD
jgi:fluoroacetyl-CoA thioesterase